MKFGIGGLSGGPDASHVGEYTSELLQLLLRYAGRDYCPALSTMGFFFTVEGSMLRKEGRGAGSARFYKADASTTCDILIPADKWQGKSPTEIKEYIAGWFVVALNKSIERIRKAGFDLNENDLRKDVAETLQYYLRGDAPTLSSAHEQIIKGAEKARELIALKRLLES